MANLNKKTLVWIIVALVVLNIASMVGHFIRHDNDRHHDEGDRVEDQMQPRHERMESFIKREVGFTDAQLDSLQSERWRHSRETKALNLEIHKRRKEIMDRAFEADPNDTISEKLLVEIGLLQTELDRLSQEHFRNMGKMCKPGQREKLKKVFGEAALRQRPKFENNDCKSNKRKFRNRNKRHDKH